MSDPRIGRLERVALREVWRHEAYDFTQWLQENLDVLNAALKLNLIVADREQAAGAFAADLVAQDETGAKTVIENQLEKSNHDHLGKLLTYAAAMGARSAIWIVSEPRPEHASAIAWLNDSSCADFYLVKVEAVRICGSPAAPFLTPVVGPLGVRSRAIARSRENFAERYDRRRQWWLRLLARPDARLHRHITPGAASWIGASSGVRGLNLNYVVLQDEAFAELYIDRGEGGGDANKSIFDQLRGRAGDVEQAFGGALQWQRLDGRRASRIRAAVPGGYRSPESEWELIQARQVDAMNRLNLALQPRLKALRLGG